MRRRSALLPLLAVVFFGAILAVPASAAAPTATGLPAITGTARAGQLLTSTTGTFAGTAPITYSRTWQRCDETGAACVPSAAASAATYTLAAADVGRTIRVTVTATNLEGSASATAPATAIVAPLAPPLNDGALPVISGTVRDGQILSHSNGGWSGTAPFTFTRMWRRCDAAGAACTALAGSTTHTLTSNDVGATIRVEVTAKNADGEGVAMSAQTAVVGAAAPVNSALPAVSGAARSGQTLTSSSPGTWSGTVPMTYARQWNRCDAGGNSCAPIAGAVGLTYVLIDDDVGATIRVAVTATNVKSSATASSAGSATVARRVPPVNGTAPSMSGSAVDGQLLTAADGSWSGTATITTARRWQRCAPLGVDCVDLAATGTTLTLASADVGFAFRTRVTASNPDGSTQVDSALTAVVAPAVPSATAAPVVSGSAHEGQLLSATLGTWKGTPAITYATAWERCSAGVCSAIAGATATTYRVVAADVGTTLRARVTATNAGGTTSAPSAATATVIGGVPVSLDVPELSGALPRDGELYGATLGTWAGTAPLVHDRQWLRCNAAGASCTALSGEVGATYRLSPADLGKTVRIEVTATNAHGATKAQSAPSPVVLAAPPVADGDPAITGDLRDGRLVTAISSWSGTAPISLTHQWQRCDALVATCADIAGATAATYTLVSADVGSRLRVRIGALNAGGGGVATSALALAGDPAGLVAADAPQATGAPVLSGTAIEGATLSSSGATFTGTTPLTRSYRWQRCNAAGTGCIDIAGATSAQVALSAVDRGSTLRAVVTAVNGSGSDSIASAPSAVVAMAPPLNLVLPSVSPETGLRDGATLIGTDGGWSGSEPMSLAYRWQRCTTASNCVNVPGAAASTYMLTTADIDFSMRLVVSASNGAGTVSQASALTAVVGTNPPVSIVAPTVIGSARDGDVLTAVDGTWTGPVVVQTTFEWWRCDTVGSNCAIVPGAAEQSLVLGPADVGLTLRARVVRTSSGGTTAAFTEPTATVVAAAPLNLAAPQISGGAAVGRLLIAEPGTWSGTPALAFEHQWRRCAADGTGCADIAGADAQTYRLVEADNGARLRVVVTASNVAGSDAATSAATAQVQIDPPEMLDPPQIDAPAGPVVAGVTLTALPGTWGGAQPMSFTYQWARCDSALAACATIAGASASTYLLAAADVGKRVIVRVTATNVVDETTDSSDATTTVLPEPPSSVGLPTVTATGGMRDGATLVASTGTWNGATPMTYAISWLRCAADGGSCGAVPGATGASYALTADDVGQRIRARVTASNVTTEVAADSAATAEVAPAPPVSSAAPTVVTLADKPAVGTGLRAQTGTWGGTAPVGLVVRWQRCPAASVAACDDVAGSTGTEYTVAGADVGKRLRIAVTATNAASASGVVATSTPTVVVPPVAPDSSVPPVIIGTAREGGELTAGTGSWNGTAPFAFTYQWQRCTSPGDGACTNVGGATRPTYVAVAADAGRYLRVSVTAANPAGKATRASAVSELVAAKAATAVPGGRTGTTGTTATGTTGTTGTTTTAKKKKKATTKKKATSTADAATGTAKPSTARRLAAIQRLKLMPSGRLRIQLRCPRTSARACGAVGTIVGGTSLGEMIPKTTLSFRLPGVMVKKGRTLTRSYKLRSAQLKELRALRDVNFRVRLAVPGTTKRFREVFVRTRVPKELRAG